MNTRRNKAPRIALKESSQDSRTQAFKPQNVFALTLGEHKKHFIGSLKRLLNEPIASSMTIIVIAIALTLPTILYLLVDNGTELTSRWQTSHDMSAYVNNSQNLDQLNQLKLDLERRSDVESIRIITADAALESLGDNTELELISDALPNNPLPHTLVITPAQTDPSTLASLSDFITQQQQVESVEFDSAWVAKLKNIIRFLKRMVWFLGILLALGVFLIVANTIRLHVNNRRNEIEVKKLIGASDQFVRRPFLYTGLWYGFLGGLLACLLILILQLLSHSPLTSLLEAYTSSHQLSLFGFTEAVTLLVIGSLLALIGAWIAAETSIRSIEPQ